MRNNNLKYNIIILTKTFGIFIHMLWQSFICKKTHVTELIFHLFFVHNVTDQNHTNVLNFPNMIWKNYTHWDEEIAPIVRI